VYRYCRVMWRWKGNADSLQIIDEGEDDEDMKMQKVNYRKSRRGGDGFRDDMLDSKKKHSCLHILVKRRCPEKRENPTVQLIESLGIRNV